MLVFSSISLYFCFGSYRFIIVYRIEFDKTRWSCSLNSYQNCTYISNTWVEYFICIYINWTIDSIRITKCQLVSKKTSSMSRVSSLVLSLAPIRFSPCMCKCCMIPTWRPFFLGRNFTLFCQNGGRTAQRTFETRAEMELSMYRLHLHINICQESHNCLN